MRSVLAARCASGTCSRPDSWSTQAAWRFYANDRISLPGLAAPLIEAVRLENEQKLRLKDADIAKREASISAQREALKQSKEAMDAEIAERLKGERKRVADEEAKKARAAFSLDLNHKDQQLEELKKLFAEREVKLVEAQKAQAEAVRKERELAEAKREMDLTIEKRVAEKQAEIQLRAKAEAEGELGLKVQEKEQTILAMQKQIEELKRKSEQGSQQLQGEVQELQLEAQLRASFPHDVIAPVPKGEFGGDAIQHVTTPFGQSCGKILWESKRTRNWSDGWLQKLRLLWMKKTGACKKIAMRLLVPCRGAARRVWPYPKCRSDQQ